MTLFEQKIKTLFTRFDADRNGMIEVDDFQKWSASLARYGRLDNDRAAALQQSLLKVWEVYFLPADTNHDGSVEYRELVAYMRAALQDSGKRAAIEATLPLIFDAIDTNADGSIAVDEFTGYFRSLGVEDSSFAGLVFKAMDANKDGSLSKEEFAAFGTEFFLGQSTRSPSRFFFGPLILDV